MEILRKFTYFDKYDHCSLKNKFPVAKNVLTRAHQTHLSIGIINVSL